MLETWTTIKDFPDYQVSTFGRVKSFKRKNTIIMTLLTDQYGYKFVNLRNGKRKVKKIHRLVIEAFSNPSALFVNHKNGVKSDNRLDNLEFVTSSGNAIHAYKLGLRVGAKGAKNGRSKLDRDDVLSIRSYFDMGTSKAALSRRFNVSETQITRICNRKAWSHV